MFENVKGLWKTQKHRAFFEQLKYKLQQSGYILLERLVNAIEYGVPQDRDRIILLGFRRNLIENMGLKLDSNEINITGNIFPWNNHILHYRSEVFYYPWPSSNSFEEDSIIYCPEGIPQNLTVEYWFVKNDVLRACCTSLKTLYIKGYRTIKGS